MASMNQIVNIVLIGAGVYIAIVYGPDIVKQGKKAIDDIWWNLQQPGAGIEGSQLPTIDQYNYPAPYGSDAGGTADMWTSPYGTEAARAPSQVPADVPGTFNPTGAYGPSTVYSPEATKAASPPVDNTNSVIDTSGLPPPPNPVPSQQQPLFPPPPAKTFYPEPPPAPVLKSRSKTPAPPLTRAQQEQQHLQNTQTSRGNIVSPPKVTVSQAHPPTSGVSSSKPSLTSRFRTGTPFRSRIEYQMGCNCMGNQCCFRGHKCDGSTGVECTTASSSNRAILDRACTALRQRFLNKNPCNAPAAAPKPTISPRLSSTTRPSGTLTSRFNRANAGYAFGDGGQIISLDSMFVTVA